MGQLPSSPGRRGRRQAGWPVAIGGGSTELETEVGLWRLLTTVAEGGERISVFEHEIMSAVSPLETKLCLQAKRRLRSIRHPNIVHFQWQQGREGDQVISVVTDPMRPLANDIAELTVQEIACGLGEMLSALNFLHDQCHVCHNNVVMSSVFVDERLNKWVLGGFEFSIAPGHDNSQLFQDIRRLQPNPLPEDEEDPETNADDADAIFQRDSFLFGKFVDDLMQHVSPHVASDASFIDFVQSCRGWFCVDRPEGRKRLSQALRHPFLANDTLAKTIAALESFTILPVERREELFVSAHSTVTKLAPEAICRRLLPLLLNRQHILADPLGLAMAAVALHVDDDVRGIPGCIPANLFREKIASQLSALFDMHDYNTTILLLKTLGKYIHAVPEEMLKGVSFYCQEALHDLDDDMVSAALVACGHVARVMGAGFLNWHRHEIFHRSLRPRDQASSEAYNGAVNAARAISPVLIPRPGPASPAPGLSGAAISTTSNSAADSRSQSRQGSSKLVSDRARKEEEREKRKQRREAMRKQREQRRQERSASRESNALDTSPSISHDHHHADEEKNAESVPASRIVPDSSILTPETAPTQQGGSADEAEGWGDDDDWEPLSTAEETSPSSQAVQPSETNPNPQKASSPAFKPSARQSQRDESSASDTNVAPATVDSHDEEGWGEGGWDDPASPHHEDEALSGHKPERKAATSPPPVTLQSGVDDSWGDDGWGDHENVDGDHFTTQAARVGDNGRADVALTNDATTAEPSSRASEQSHHASPSAQGSEESTKPAKKPSGLKLKAKRKVVVTAEQDADKLKTSKVTTASDTDSSRSAQPEATRPQLKGIVTEPGPGPEPEDEIENMLANLGPSRETLTKSSMEMQSLETTVSTSQSMFSSKVTTTSSSFTMTQAAVSAASGWDDDGGDADGWGDEDVIDLGSDVEAS